MLSIEKRASGDALASPSKRQRRTEDITHLLSLHAVVGLLINRDYLAVADIDVIATLCHSIRTVIANCDLEACINRAWNVEEKSTDLRKYRLAHGIYELHASTLLSSDAYARFYTKLSPVSWTWRCSFTDYRRCVEEGVVFDVDACYILGTILGLVILAGDDIGDAWFQDQHCIADLGWFCHFSKNVQKRIYAYMVKRASFTTVLSALAFTDHDPQLAHVIAALGPRKHEHRFVRYRHFSANLPKPITLHDPVVAKALLHLLFDCDASSFCDALLRTPLAVLDQIEIGQFILRNERRFNLGSQANMEKGVRHLAQLQCFQTRLAVSLAILVRHQTQGVQRLVWEHTAIRRFLADTDCVDVLEVHLKFAIDLDPPVYNAYIQGPFRQLDLKARVDLVVSLYGSQCPSDDHFFLTPDESPKYNELYVCYGLAVYMTRALQLQINKQT